MGFFSYAKTHEALFTQYGQKIVYKKGQYLVTIHDESPWVFFLTEGLVRVSFTFSDGNERLIGYFLPGMSFAKSGSFFAHEGGALEYLAQMPTTVLRMHREDFFAQLRSNPDFNAEYIDMILKNQIFLIERIVYQGETGIEKKFLRWLYFMAKYYGEPRGNSLRITVATSQEDIANFLHTTRVSVSKVVKKYTEKHIISVQKKHIYIANVDELHRLTEGKSYTQTK